MNCHRVQSLISAYVDGELPGIEMLAMREHLSGCKDCGYEYESILLVKRSLGRLSPRCPSTALAVRIYAGLDQVSVSAEANLVAAFRKRFSGFNCNFRLVTATAAVAVSMLLFGSALLENTGPAYDASSPIGLVRSLEEQDPIHYFAIPSGTRAKSTLLSDMRMSYTDWASTGASANTTMMISELW